jgi:hypothetical protein
MNHPVRPFLPSLFLKSLVVLAVAATGTARADETTYEIKKTTPRATVGVPGKASVTLQGKNGWHVNDVAPITVTLKADPGVDLPKQKMARADLAESSKESARFDIPFSASSPGKKTITAEAHFVMCQKEACKPGKETVAMEIDVAAATVAPASNPKKNTKKSVSP